MTQSGSQRGLLVADAVSALGELPAEVHATSPLGAYQLCVVDVSAGKLAAQCSGEQRPGVGAVLCIRTASERRAAHDIECVISHARGDRVKLEVRSVTLVATRRASRRAPTNELFLVYGQIEVDAEVINISKEGMRFVCPIDMEVGAEVRGMLNIQNHVFPIAAEVRHTTKRPAKREIGVTFRNLRQDERDLLARLTDTHDTGRRSTETGTTASLPAEDIRERLRRWAA
jgi:hypothetical protein